MISSLALFPSTEYFLKFDQSILNQQKEPKDIVILMLLYAELLGELLVVVFATCL